MFYYYGRKRKIAKHYPPALHDTIIEPFAGSAAYSCQESNCDRQVILVEKDPVVVGVWTWLLSASDAELSTLPDLTIGQKTSDPVHIMASASKRWWQYKTITVTPVIHANWNASRRLWVKMVPRIRHWQVIQGDYTAAPDLTATWFIDPPYSGDRGTGYRFGSPMLDYPALGEWAKDRKGQTIVCEADDATWLPFQPLVSLVGVAGKRFREGVWLNV